MSVKFRSPLELSAHRAIAHSDAAQTLTVTVAAKTVAHPEYGNGSSNGYLIDGVEGAYLEFTPGNTYKFDQSDSSNSGHPLRFYEDAAKTTAYTTGVTTNGTPGSSGAYTQIIPGTNIPPVLFYQCSAHALMGSYVKFGTGTIGDTYSINVTQDGNDVDLKLDANSGTDSTVQLTAGSNITLTRNSAQEVEIASTASGGITGINIQDEGSALSTAATTLNFTGAAVTASGTGTTKTIDITGGGGGSGGTVTVEKNVYTGNGSNTTFNTSTAIVNENNVQVYIDGVYQSKDNYTTNGSTVTFSTAPPNTTSVELIHMVAVDGVIARDGFTGNGSTTAFVLSMSITNENATQVYIDGVYQSKDNYTTSGSTLTFSTAPPNGAAVEVVHIKAFALSGFNKNNFTGTGSQTAFTLNAAVNEENMTFVFLEGIYQDKSTYSISGSTLTFVTAPQNGYGIEVMVLGAISAASNALFTDTFTGNGSTATYALGITPHDLNAVEVYLNGLYQNVSTLSLSGQNLTFSTPPPSGVIIEVRSIGGLNSGGTLAPATLIGGTGISVVTNSTNNFTISNTLVDVTVSWATPSGQSLTYTNPSPQSSIGQAGSIFTTTTFTITKAAHTLSGTAVLTGLPTGVTIASQSYNNNNPGNVLTITLGGIYPSANALNTGIIVSGLTATVAPPIVDYLVVAGGGGGGTGPFTNANGGGGGGAGGLRTSYGTATGGGGSPETALTLVAATNYTLTVGAGAATSAAGGTHGADGSNSVFATVTSTGGGGGGSEQSVPGRAGGSGGGASYNGAGGTATASPVQGKDGGTSTTSNGIGGAGGGGAGVVGATNVGGHNGGNGGNGLQNAITLASGTGPYYAGGGGGGTYSHTSAKTGGTGGQGGGGQANSQAAGSPGTANTGGGGGGSDNAYAARDGGAGGSGIVILRYSSALTISNPGSGLTFTTDNTTVANTKITTFTAGTGNIQFN